MTKMPNIFCMSYENIVAGPMTKQRVFSGFFDPEKLHIPRKREWHKGC
jgi:hypothetical protein